MGPFRRSSRGFCPARRSRTESDSGRRRRDTLQKQDLVSDEIAVHIEAGKLVTKLALDWQERIQLVLSDDGSLKRLKFSETIRDQNEDIDRDDYAQRFDADFILMTSELAALIKNIIEALGGESEK